MNVQMSDLLRIVYFSRNRIVLPGDGMAAEIDDILRASRENNARDGVTGALIHNGGVFGQVLEGPAAAVEEAFERIQLDDRHTEVTLLAIEPITSRGFTGWSMGFVGAENLPPDDGTTSPMAAFDISLLSGEEIYGVLHKLMLKNEMQRQAA